MLSLLGVSRVLAVDIDADSVGATKALLAQNLSIPWQAEQISAFELDPSTHGAFDIVYSYGFDARGYPQSGNINEARRDIRVRAVSVHQAGLVPGARKALVLSCTSSLAKRNKSKLCYVNCGMLFLAPREF